MSSGCILNVYPNHALPEPGFNYFTVPKVAGNLTDNPTPQSEHLLVCIPSYNEISKDLMKTLMSVHEQAVGLPETRVSCLIILDGWRMSHSSMRQTLAGLMGETCVVRDEYGKSCAVEDLAAQVSSKDSPRTVLENKNVPSNPSIEQYKQENVQTSIDRFSSPTCSIVAALDALCSDPSAVGTCILENIDPESQDPIPVQISPGKYLELTVMVKLDNRRKHNSHQWFLSAYGKAFQSTASYFLLTDAGTYFSPTCIPKLVQFLRDGGDDYCAVVAFQRPSVPKIKVSVQGAVELLCGLSQSYEFYAANYGVAAACANFGFQPVIPGPCQLITASAGLNEEFQQMYFEVGQGDPVEHDFVTANMCLAEDRFFTNFLYTCTKKKIGYEPKAVFHYSLSVVPAEFINQRRRWLNGTVAASYQLLVDYPVWSKGLSKARARSVYATMVWYNSLITTGFITPGFVAGSLFQAFASQLQVVYGCDYESKTLCAPAFLTALPLWVFYMASFATFTIVHHQSKFVRPLFLTCLFFNMLNMILIMFFSVYILQTSVAARGGQAFYYFLTMFVGFSFPAIMSVLLGDWGGVIWGSVCAPFFMLFRSAYSLSIAFSISQSWNVSWGTRPTDTNSKAGEMIQIAADRHKPAAYKLMVVYLCSNLFVGVVSLAFAYHKMVVCVLVLNCMMILPVLSSYPPACLFYIRWFATWCWKFVPLGVKYMLLSNDAISKMEKKN